MMLLQESPYSSTPDSGLALQFQLSKYLSLCPPCLVLLYCSAIDSGCAQSYGVWLWEDVKVIQ